MISSKGAEIINLVYADIEEFGDIEELEDLPDDEDIDDFFYDDSLEKRDIHFLMPYVLEANIRHENTDYKIILADIPNIDTKSYSLLYGDVYFKDTFYNIYKQIEEKT